MIFEELKTKEDDYTGVNPNAWLLSLIDLISLIFSFFVLMYSTKDLSPEKYDEIKSSIVKYMDGKKNEKTYHFVEKATGNVVVIKKAADINYLENILKSSFANNANISISANEDKNKISVAFENELNDKKDFSRDMDEDLIAISKSINPITNQIQIIVNSSDTTTSLDVSDMISKKLEEFGYEQYLLRTLPNNFITENIEKDKNKVRIEIIINNYETIF